MEDVHDEMLTEHLKLDNNQARDFFLKTVSDLQDVKLHAVVNLSNIASKVSSAECKLLILESGTIMNGQIIRLSLITTLLGSKTRRSAQSLRECTGLDNYMLSNVVDKSAVTDALILTRFIFVAHIEISSFQLLIEMAATMRTKAILPLLMLCLTEAKVGKTMLESMLHKHI